jgi:hypothetical protein
MVRAAHPAQVRACFLRSRDLPRRIDILGRAIFSDHVSLAITCGNFSGRYPIRARGSDERTHKENWTQPGMAESSWRYTASTFAGLAAPEPLQSRLAGGARRATWCGFAGVSRPAIAPPGRITRDAIAFTGGVVPMRRSPFGW